MTLVHGTRRFARPTDRVAAARSNVALEMFRAMTRTVLFDQTAALRSMNRVDDTSDACAKSPARAPFLSLMGSFLLISLSIGINCFAVPSLVALDMPLALASAALTVFLAGSADGVLLSGALTDRARRHGLIAATRFCGVAVMAALVAFGDLPLIGILLALGALGIARGLCVLARHTPVRAAPPPGQAGAVFGIISKGFNFGGVVSPLLFGWLIDACYPQAVFWAAAAFMMCTALAALAALAALVPALRQEG